jgi:hypothetical protein
MNYAEGTPPYTLTDSIRSGLMPAVAGPAVASDFVGSFTVSATVNTPSAAAGVPEPSTLG